MKYNNLPRSNSSSKLLRGPLARSHLIFDGNFRDEVFEEWKCLICFCKRTLRRFVTWQLASGNVYQTSRGKVHVENVFGCLFWRVRKKTQILTMEGLEDKICHFPMGEIWSREPWKEGGLLQPLQLRPGGLRVLRPWRLCPKGACVFFFFLHARGLWFLPFLPYKVMGAPISRGEITPGKVIYSGANGVRLTIENERRKGPHLLGILSFGFEQDTRYTRFGW